MKLKFFIAICCAFLLVQCDQKQEIEVGEITERSAEEMAAFKEYAPKFTFQSMAGDQVSLDQLKGKILYIDIWATWCKPCLQQLPAMKELEEKYRGSNVEFISISVDADKDKAKWASMVKEKGMQGIQLFAGRGTSFHQDYKISSIPRFLIIGKDGELINDDAPRPMDHMSGQINQELVTILDSYNN